jgi:hypothetical protein
MDLSLKWATGSEQPTSGSVQDEIVALARRQLEAQSSHGATPDDPKAQTDHRVRALKSYIDTLIEQRQFLAENRAQREDTAADAKRQIADLDAQISVFLGEYRALLIQNKAAESGDEGMVKTSRPMMAHQNSASSTEDSEEDSTIYQLKMPDQEFVLLQVAHEQLKPRAKEPAFRVCGMYSDIESVREAGRQLAKEQPECSVQVKQVHAPFLVTNTYQKMFDVEYNRDHIKRIQDNAELRFKFRKTDFDNNYNKSKKSIGKTHLDDSSLKQAALPSTEVKPETVSKLFESESPVASDSEKKEHNLFGDSATQQTSAQAVVETPTKSTAVAGAPNSNSNRMSLPFPQSCRQFYRFAVVVIDLDYDPAVDFVSKEAGLAKVCADTDECLVTFLASFESQKQAANYVKKCASLAHTTKVVDVVDMYEWIYPKTVQDQRDLLPEHYSHPKQNELMRGRKVAKVMNEMFEQECRDQGIQVPVTTIARDGTVFGVDMTGHGIETKEVVTNGIRHSETVSMAEQMIETRNPVSLLQDDD